MVATKTNDVSDLLLMGSACPTPPPNCTEPTLATVQARDRKLAAQAQGRARGEKTYQRIFAMTHASMADTCLVGRKISVNNNTVTEEFEDMTNDDKIQSTHHNTVDGVDTVMNKDTKLISDDMNDNKQNKKQTHTLARKLGVLSKSNNTQQEGK